jgi:hypothetical protein
MGATIVAVLGTLAGALLSGLLQQRVTARSERAAREAQQRQRVEAAVTELVRRLVAYRRHAYLKINAVRDGRDLPESARVERYEAHSNATVALAALRLTEPGPEIVAAAKEAVAASLDLRNATPETVADGPRQRTRQADDALLAAAARATNA